MGKISEQYFGKPLEEVEAPDIQVLIDEQTIEDYSLDYTEIPKRISYDELAKNISAFLNTNGGLVIFGVREQKKKYPKEITWGKISKETLVRSLRGKIEPWHDNLEFRPVYNPENDDELVFIIEVPKSLEPPHMGSGKYYIRNVYESRPMGHYEIENKFKQSYLYKDKIIENVIGPIFNEVEIIYHNIEYDYKSDTSIMDKINYSYRYLLYQTHDIEFITYVDDFYSVIKEYNSLVGRYYGIINRIIKKVVQKIMKDMYRGLIERQTEVLQYKRGVLYSNLSVGTESANIAKALLYKIHPREELKRQPHVKEIYNNVEISIIPGQPEYKQKLDNNKFIEIYGECETIVSETEEITSIWSLKKKITLLCEELMDLCLVKM